MNIMILDDHKLTAKLIEVYLAHQKEINNVYTVNTGKELFKELKQKDVDLVLTDLAMPEMDGMEVIDKLHDKHPSLKVMVLSVHDESWMIEKAFNHGVCAYISKQSPRDELVSAVLNADNSKPYLSKNMQGVYTMISGGS